MTFDTHCLPRFLLPASSWEADDGVLLFTPGLTLYNQDLFLFLFSTSIHELC